MKAIAFVLLAFIQTSLSGQPTKVDENTQKHLAAFRKATSEALVKAVPAKLSSYYHDDIRLTVEFQRTMSGKSNVTEYFKALTGRFNISKFEMAESESLNLGKMIVEFGSLSIAMQLKSNHELHDLKGKYIMIWERNSKGELSLITLGWNYNQYIEFGDQFRFPDVSTVDVALGPHSPITDNLSFELAALNRWMETVISQHDAALWSRFYAEDGIFFTQHRDPCIGKRSIDEYLKKHVSEMPVFENLAIRNDRIDALDNYVIEYASHVAVWRNSGSSGISCGKDIRIWRREPDGALKIFRHIGMYD